MNTNVKPLVASLLAAIVVVPFQSQALPISLGVAGPGNWAVLETANRASSANVSIANASNAGFITGNVGINGKGNLSDSGTPITGDVYADPAAAINSNVGPNVSGSIFQSAAADTLLNQAASDAAAASAAASALFASSIANITSGQTLNGGGVFNLAKIALNNATLTLSGSASDYYVFNISDSLTLSHSSILLSGGLTADNVLFNITRNGGTGLGMSGGLSTESVLYGIVLANKSQVSVTPGLVVGEIISGDNVSIASGAQVEGITVPDAGGSFALLSLGMGLLVAARRKLAAA